MKKDQHKAPPAPRSKFLWILLAVAVVVLVSLWFVKTSKAPQPPSSTESPAPTPDRPPEISPLEKHVPSIDASNAVESTGSVAEFPPVRRLERPRTPSEPAEAPDLPNIIYNPPTKMTVGETKRIEVRITDKKLSAAVFAEELQGEGEVQSDNILIGKSMSVMLCCGEPSEDYPFDITPLNQYRQSIGTGNFTQWAFRVTPQKKGKQALNLSVTVHQKVPGGGEDSYSIPVKTESIEVDVDPARELKTLLAENWQWLALLIMTPLLVMYVTRSFRGKKREAVSGNESVFISYRRDDSSGYSLAIYEKLKLAIGGDKVFMDMDDIPHGVDFSEHLEQVLENVSTVLVMIGDGWLNASNEYGRRLDNPSDFVRMEVATALARDIRVIPVLLKNAQMPNKHELPEALQSLSKRNAIRIYDDQFEASIQKLIESIG